MKHVVAASLAFGAAALTGFGQIAPAAVYAAEQTETVKTESTKSGEQADEGLFKEEKVSSPLIFLIPSSSLTSFKLSVVPAFFSQSETVISFTAPFASALT